MLNSFTLVIGGASSGKSRYAEGQINAHTGSKLYIATAQVFDDEMAAKIAAHQSDRDARWRTLECPLAPWEGLAQAASDEIVLLDCATMWLSNLLLTDGDIATATDQLCAAIAQCAAPVVVVTNEVGHGIVPENALARAFRIEQGRLNQRLATQADRVVAVMAGLPFALKGTL